MKADSMRTVENRLFYFSAGFLCLVTGFICVAMQMIGILYFILGTSDGDTVHVPGIIMVNALCLFFIIRCAQIVDKLDNERREWNEFYIKNDV